MDVGMMLYCLLIFSPSLLRHSSTRKENLINSSRLRRKSRIRVVGICIVTWGNSSDNVRYFSLWNFKFCEATQLILVGDCLLTQVQGGPHLLLCSRPGSSSSYFSVEQAKCLSCYLSFGFRDRGRVQQRR